MSGQTKNKVLVKIRDDLLQRVQVLENKNADVSEVRNLTRERKNYWKSTLGLSKGEFKEFWLNVQQAVYDARGKAREREESSTSRHAFENQQQHEKVKAAACKTGPQKARRIPKSAILERKIPASERKPLPSRKPKKVVKAPSTLHKERNKRSKVDTNDPWGRFLDIGTTRFVFEWESVKNI